VPDSAAFANLATLLGEDNQLGVWWRSTDDWRVDRIRSTGRRTSSGEARDRTLGGLPALSLPPRRQDRPGLVLPNRFSGTGHPSYDYRHADGDDEQ
jgi:hypothetical protein